MDELNCMMKIHEDLWSLRTEYNRSKRIFYWASIRESHGTGIVIVFTQGIWAIFVGMVNLDSFLGRDMGNTLFVETFLLSIRIFEIMTFSPVDW